MNELKIYLKNVLIAFLGIFVYFFLGSIQTLPFEILNIDISILPTYIKILYSIMYDLLIICLLIIIFNKTLTENYKDLKLHHKEYFSKCFKYWLIGLAIMYISNFIIMYLMNKGITNNEETIRNLFQATPLFVYFSAVIFAPFVEELIFRKSLKNIFPNKYLFIIISGLAFGYAHISTGFSSLSDLVYLIPYGSLGVMFAIMLEKTKNIYVSMGFHLMHNGILMSLQFLLLFLG